MAGGAGRLDVVATPIGNIGDLSPRAVESLKGADLILAEDTRRTATLLSACAISRLVSPSAAIVAMSSMIAFGSRLTSRPRVDGTMQYAQTS